MNVSCMIVHVLLKIIASDQLASIQTVFYILYSGLFDEDTRRHLKVQTMNSTLDLCMNIYKFYKKYYDDIYIYILLCLKYIYIYVYMIYIYVFFAYLCTNWQEVKGGLGDGGDGDAKAWPHCDPLQVPRCQRCPIAISCDCYLLLLRFVFCCCLLIVSRWFSQPPSLISL